MEADVLIIGSGAAGLTAALQLAATRKVVVLAKGSISDGATAWAQGGIAAVLEPGDNFASHIEDTMVAGAGLNNRATVEFVVENAPIAIERLAKLGVPFNLEGNDWHLTREGGHSHRRIVHVDDATGWAVQQALEAAARANPNITLVPDMVAVDLILGRHQERFSTSGRIHGVYALNRKTGQVETFTARATILASGGAGRTYLYSTAPRGATGDGIAMAWRAGCRVSNMEFMQFHPTVLYIAGGSRSLITEAVRGAGAYLVDREGHRFMPEFDARAELAPRDVVSRAITEVMRRTSHSNVYLDLSHLESQMVRKRFPGMEKLCRKFGLDLATDRIPVRPGAHYMIGGVAVDSNGQTSVPRLFAAGEVASTGLHGANRLASNSLLEALVFSHRAALDVIIALKKTLPKKSFYEAIPEWKGDTYSNSVEIKEIRLLRLRLQEVMTNYLGIFKTTEGLKKADVEMFEIYKRVHEIYNQHKLTNGLCELRNMVSIAHLIIQQAQSITENKGVFYNQDYAK